MESRAADEPSGTTVLVTGGSGFVGSYVILALLAQGYTVRTTVRRLSREPATRAALESAGASPESLDRLTFVAADLASDDGWAEAVRGCAFVQHVASPFPAAAPKHEDELIVPAREGTLRVLRAARDAGVKRVVLTSSFAAIGYGHRKEAYTEEDWSVLDGDKPIPAYHKSKALAEKAAWDFAAQEGIPFDLAVVNPVGVFGPVISTDFSPSVEIVQKLLDGSMPACPQISFSMVDVRDLADLHIRAMVTPAAGGQRFLGSADGRPLSFLDTARIIKQGRPERSAKVPTKQLPNWVVKGMAIFNPRVRQIVSQLGDVRVASNDKAKAALGWKPRPVEETILDTVDSLFAHGIV